ncbi:hypothetical protein ACQRXC_29390 (plasmid) [Niallia taxi]|uniref:hypothetical protein n=1 Tax=Niallia taxi TaxID=2499688 RepID=UPI003F6053A6
MLVDKHWTDYLPVIIIAIGFSLLIWCGIALNEQQKKNKHSDLVFEENQYETMSNYLNTDEKQIIISGAEDGYLVKTNGKSYTVIFNDDGKEIEKIIEN